MAKPKIKQQITLIGLGLMACILVLIGPFVINVTATGAWAQISTSLQRGVPVWGDRYSQSNVISLIAQGKQLYQTGQLVEAIRVLERALISSPPGPDQIRAYRYLSIAYQALGQWEQAETALADAFSQLTLSSDQLLQAQLFNTQGRLQLNQGNVEAALESWQTAEGLYQQRSDSQGMVLSQINQAQALRSLGHYRRAQQLLEHLATTIDRLASPALKADLQRSLGSTLIAVGDLPTAHQLFLDSLSIAQSLDDKEAMAACQFQLGHINKALGQIPMALNYYIAAAQGTDLPRVKIEAQLGRLNLLADTDPVAAIRLLPEVQASLNQQHPSRWSLYGQISLVNSWIKITQNRASNIAFRAVAPAMATQLAQTIRQAEQIQDRRAETLALAQMGSLYERTHQWRDALTLTEQAIELAKHIRAGDLLVKSYWQRGRILKAQKKFQPAISAYENSVKQLQQLRQDLVAMNPDVQFSFRDQVEPIYRELTQLLLREVDQLPDSQQQEYLQKARTTIESLQLAELQNFFQEACKTYAEKSIESIDQQAAVIYSIVLGQQLEVIFSRPGQPLKHHRTELTVTELTDTFNTLRQSLNPAFLSTEHLRPAQRIYDWLLRPFEADVAQTKTLVFVLDDFLRDIPMAVLHDGQHYLIENHAVVLTPGLQLFESVPLPTLNLRTLVGGLTQVNQGFSALPGVAEELTQISQQVSAKTLIDQQFTRNRLQAELAETDFSILHLATHGQFSSQPDQTFLLTWNDRIGVQDLKRWIQREQTPLELMILSACQTAKGDNRATLGLAGLTLQAGARSSIATLWAVQDHSTAALMTSLYDGFVNRSGNRAEILRQAQLQLLHSETFQHPYYWAAFVLIGNWL